MCSYQMFYNFAGTNLDTYVESSLIQSYFYFYLNVMNMYPLSYLQQYSQNLEKKWCNKHQIIILFRHSKYYKISVSMQLCETTQVQN